MKKQLLMMASLFCLCTATYAAKGGIGTIFGALIGGAVGNAAGKAASQHMTMDEAIARMADEVNKQLPMAIDPDTRMDNISPGVGRRFTYNYTLVNSQSRELDGAALYREFRPILRKRVCTSDDMAIFFKNGVTVSYSYKGNDGGQVFKVDMSPQDCGYSS